jgi:hypothetical protein
MKLPRYLQPILLFGAALYLYGNLFSLPNTPFLLNGDQVYFWMHGLQILQGEHIYRDFFQFTPPGTDLFYFALFRTLGPQVWVTNLAVLLLGVAICWTCFRLASQLMEWRCAALASSLFVTLVYGRLINATHHWFSVALILSALTVVAPRRTLGRLAVAGSLLGLAAFFTQTHALAAVLAITGFLIWERFATKASGRSLATKVALLILCIAAALLVVYAPYVADDGLPQLWYFQFTYVRTYMVVGQAPPNLGLPAVWTPAVLGQTIGVYALTLLIYPLILLHCWRHRRNPDSEENMRLALLSFVGLALLAEVLVDVNWLRLYSVSMPAVILLVWAASGTGQLRGYIRGLLWVLVVVLAIGQIGQRQSQKVAVSALPGGVVAANPQASDKLQWLASHTTPGEPFFQAPWPGLYLPLGLRNPLFLDDLSTYTQKRPQDIMRTIGELDRNSVRYVLWQPRIDHRDPTRPWDYQLTPMREYLHDRYRQVHIFPDRDEVWERR